MPWYMKGADSYVMCNTCVSPTMALYKRVYKSLPLVIT